MRHFTLLLAALPLLLLAQAAGGLECSANAQAVGFQTFPAPVGSGVALDVTPVVSADRRYVRMGMNVGFNDLMGFSTFSVPAAVSGGGAAGMNGLLGMGGLGGGGVGAGGRIGAGGVVVGMPAAGLGEPAAGLFPGGAFAASAGDPFEQALKASSRTPQPKAAAPPARQFAGTGAQARPRAGTTSRAGAAHQRRSTRPRKRYMPTGPPAVAPVMPESPGLVPFNP